MLLASVGSLIMIGFGIWHFFVPKLWNWYGYIHQKATELILAVRAINYFFSLTLVLLGVVNLLLVWRQPWDEFSLKVVLGISAFLWLNRIILQLIHPQGSKSAKLQYGMLFAFILVFLCFIGSFLLFY
jgi:hypothetical protein